MLPRKSIITTTDQMRSLDILPFQLYLILFKADLNKTTKEKELYVNVREAQSQTKTFIRHYKN